RLPRLEALAQRAPDYAPVFYALGQEYTRGLRATYTQNLRDQQSEAFNTLFQLEEIQLYSSHFIDKSRAQEDLADAAVSLEEYANAGFLELDFISFYAHEGLTVIVIMPEANWQELRFGLDEPEPNHATDNPTIGPIPLEKGAHTLYIQYTDVNGADSAVYTFDYTIDDIVINYQQQPFDFSLDGIPVLFTMAVVGSNPDGVYNYNYSIDSEALDETVLGVGQAGVINFGPVEPGEHTLYVQAVGGDAETEIVEFPFTVEGE
ncbi:MAG: hypothetical protein GY803_05785, partial [Chloroflexi bacterium]|nr:hypothetical protein [Chloroflexota bacterium]